MRYRIADLVPKNQARICQRWRLVWYEVICCICFTSDEFVICPIMNHVILEPHFKYY